MAKAQVGAIDLTVKEKKSLFKTEITDALGWLSGAYDDINKGWGYIPDIPINPQNTAEAIFTYIQCYDLLSEEQVEILKETIDAFVEDAKIGTKYTIDYVWILKALGEIKSHIHLFGEELLPRIDDVVVDCLGYFFMSQNADGGWADIKGEVSAVSRTALVLQVMSKVLFEPTEYQQNALDKAIAWLLKMQNLDGGWGDINKSDITHEYMRGINLSYSQLELQYLSNAASTGYAMLALKAIKPHAYKDELNKAAEYLIKTQESDGHWELFSEFTLRNGLKFTFRHLSSVIATEALLKTYSIDYSSEILINAVNYLIGLQVDQVYDSEVSLLLKPL